MHSAIKPGNAVLDLQRGILGLIDWGCAKPFWTPVVEGNLMYMPPECFKKVKDAEGAENYALYVAEQMPELCCDKYDIWGAALLLLYWHLGFLPMMLLSNDKGIRAQFTQADMDKFLGEHLADDFVMRRFFELTLMVDPKERWGADQAVGHMYIEGYVAKASHSAAARCSRHCQCQAALAFTQYRKASYNKQGQVQDSKHVYMPGAHLTLRVHGLQCGPA